MILNGDFWVSYNKNEMNDAFSVGNLLIFNITCLVPKENVATIALSACVIEGVSRSRNALINGETRGYDWDSG